MNALMHICVCLALALLGGVSSVARAGQPLQTQGNADSYFPSDAAIGEFILPYVDELKAKGIVIGLIEPDGRRRVLTFGSAGDGARPLSASSVFETGSLAKTFTGVVFADMVRRGEVTLEDPVAKYLPPGVRAPSRDGRQITLIDLATHTSGLPRYPTGYEPPDPSNPYAQYSAEHLYDFLNRYELGREPGAEFEYSNVGMGLLGHALALAAGADGIQTLVADRVLRPLGMSMTAYGATAALAPWMTKGHDQNGWVAPPFDVAVLAGAGGINSNVTDLMTYLEANIGEPTSPLEHAMRDAHRAHQFPRPGMEMGLGWMTTRRGSINQVGNRGGSAGYSSYVAFDPETRAGVVVLANTGGFEYADKIGRDLLNPEQRPLVAAPAPPAATPNLAQLRALRIAHHQHLVSPQFASIVGVEPIDGTALLAMLDAAGAERGVVLSVAYTFADERKNLSDPDTRVRQENDWTASQVAAAHGRLYGFCGVNPLTQGALDEIERCNRLPGMRGVKLHFGNSGVSLRNDTHATRVREVFALADRLRVPITVHMRSRGGTDYGAEDAVRFIEQLLPVAQNITVQVAHLAGSGPGHGADADSALEVFADRIRAGDSRTTGLLFDATTVVAPDTTDEEGALVARRIRELGVSRVLFGSDLPIGSNPRLAEAWQLFRTKVPLTDAEFARIATNVAPYLQ